ncbi:unnamed protein product [Jaminaea pallidilutea]
MPMYFIGNFHPFYISPSALFVVLSEYVLASQHAKPERPEKNPTLSLGARSRLARNENRRTETKGLS